MEDGVPYSMTTGSPLTCIQIMHIPGSKNPDDLRRDNGKDRKNGVSENEAE